MSNIINIGGGAGGSGSNVVPNPQGTATDTLTKIGIDGTIYGFAGNGGHNYSTTEQVVGTWIDGKPLYEKTIVYSGNIAHNSYKTIDNSLSYSGVDFFTVLNTSVKLATVDTWFTYSFGGLYYDLALSDALGVYVENFSNIYNISDVVVTICYTKTST